MKSIHICFLGFLLSMPCSSLSLSLFRWMAITGFIILAQRHERWHKMNSPPVASTALILCSLQLLSLTHKSTLKAVQIDSKSTLRSCPYFMWARRCYLVSVEMYTTCCSCKPHVSKCILMPYAQSIINHLRASTSLASKPQSVIVSCLQTKAKESQRVFV